MTTHPATRFGLSLLALLAVVSCSVHAGVVVRDDTSSYKGMWSRDWTAVIRAAEPWLPTAGRPGACDKGGTMMACYATDQRVLPLLRALRDDLKAVRVPAQYADGNQLVIDAINADGKALSDRDQAIRTGSNALFQSAVQELQTASDLFQKAWSRFPSGDLPSPAPFGGRRVG